MKALRKKNSIHKMKIAFWGTPELTIPILNSLEEAGFLPSIIITGPDRQQGRGLVMTPPAPKIWAEERNIPYLQPEKINTEFISEVKNLNLDISVVVAYGKILPDEIINLPKFGTLNTHYSLLPRWRGATPVESAILLGDKETGVCIQQMVYKLDAGAIHAQEKITIGEHETAPDLRERLNFIGARLLVETLKSIELDSARPTEQDESGMTRCGKIEKENGLVDPNGNAVENDRKFRAYYGWPGSYFFIQKDGKQMRIKITDAILENDAWIIKKVVPEGKKEINYEEFLKQK